MEETPRRGPGRPRNEVHAEYMGPDTPRAIGGDDPYAVPLMESEQPIEVVTGDFRKQITTEGFMNEMVLIRIAEATHENDVIGPCPSVNGVNMPLVRGQPTWVKRMFVENLARAKQQRYHQSITDPSDPSKRELVPNTSLVYPFSVLKDPNPLGAKWLETILREPA